MDFTCLYHRVALFHRLRNFQSISTHSRLDALLGDDMSERFYAVQWRANEFYMRYGKAPCGKLEDKWPVAESGKRALTFYTRELTIVGKVPPPFNCYADSKVVLEGYNDQFLHFLHEGLRYVSLPGRTHVWYSITENELIEERIVPFAQVLEQLGRELRLLQAHCYTLCDRNSMGDALIQFSLKHDLVNLKVKPRLAIFFIDDAELEQFWRANVAALTDSRLQFTIILQVEFLPDADPVKQLLDPHFTTALPHSGFDICVTGGSDTVFYNANRDGPHQNGCGIREDDGSDLWVRGEVELHDEQSFSSDPLKRRIFASIANDGIQDYEDLQIENWNPHTVSLLHADLRCLRVCPSDPIAAADFNEAMEKLSVKVDFITFECASLLSVDFGQTLLDFSVRHKLQHRSNRPRFSVAMEESDNGVEDGLTFLQRNLDALADPRQQFVVEIHTSCFFPDPVWRSKVQVLLQPFFRSVPLQNENGRIWNAFYDLFFVVSNVEFAFVRRS